MQFKTKYWSTGTFERGQVVKPGEPFGKVSRSLGLWKGSYTWLHLFELNTMVQRHNF